VPPLAWPGIARVFVALGWRRSKSRARFRRATFDAPARRSDVGRSTFVFTTPEQLAATDLRQLISSSSMKPTASANGGTISDRPDLDALSGLRAFGSPTIQALTATATPDVIADSERQLAVGPLRRTA
jgi:ATP-dependent DNA helicase RecQ